jgi:hypothetical protein
LRFYMKRERRWRPFSASCYTLHHQPAAGLNDLTRQPPCLLTDQKRHHIGHVGRKPEPFEG